MVRFYFTERQAIRVHTNISLLLGHFSWGAKDFSQHARHTFLSIDGPDRIPILHSELQNHSGDFIPNEINLTTHIYNIDGQLVFDR